MNGIRRDWRGNDYRSDEKRGRGELAAGVAGLILTLALCGSPQLAAQVTAADSMALVDLYNATGGSSWSDRTNWLTTAPVAEWFWVTVSGDRVVSVELSYNNLSGTIPQSIGNLDRLYALSLSNNELTGTIPASIGSLGELQRLNLGHNQLSGSIPSEIGNAKLLSQINFYGNMLTGSIPGSIYSLSRLESLELGENNIEGEIPQQITNLQELRVLDLSGTKVSGSFPAVSSFPNLSQFYISNTGITATLEQLFPEQAPSLYYINADGVRLSGTLRTSYFNPATIEFIDMGGAGLTGAEDFSSFPNLKRLSLYGNRLDFDDIKPNLTVAQFYYSPQDSLLSSEDQTLKQGSMVTIRSGLSDPAAEYEWRKDGKEIVGEDDSTLVLPGLMPDDGGTYTVEITRSDVPGLTLYRAAYHLTVDPTNSVDDEAESEVSIRVDRRRCTIEVGGVEGRRRGEDAITYSIVEIQGTIVAAGSVDRSVTIELPVSGIYLITTEKRDGTIVTRKVALR